MKTSVFITGGLGFIGSNIVRYLIRNTSYNIVIFDRATYAGRKDNIQTTEATRKRIKIIFGDILKRREVENAMSGCQCVLHLAANTHTFHSLKKVRSTMLTNVIGTTILLESSINQKISRFILFSSSEVYGNQIPGVPMDELHPLNPVTPYAASKIAADRLAFSFWESKKLPVVILRPFNAYGPYQHVEKMIPLFITSLLTNHPIYLNHGGRQYRDFVYVEDLARAVKMVLEAESTKINGQVFNVGTGNPTTIRTVAEKIQRLIGKEDSYLKISEVSQPETMGNVGISKKISSVLGWRPEFSIDDGLKKTISWYRDNELWWKNQ